MKKIALFGLALLLALPLAALADAIVQTREGYRIAWENGAGEALLLSRRERLEDGLVVDVDAAYTLLDAKANTLYSKWFGGDGQDVLSHAVPVASGGWLAAGASSSGDLSNGWHEGWYDTFETKTDGWVVRIAEDGEVLWNRCYGGTDWDSFAAVCEAWGGGFILAGQTQSRDGDVEGWHGSGELFEKADGWVVCIDEAGEMLWQRTLGGSGEDALYGVCAVEGGYLLVGETDSLDGDVEGALGDTDGWVVLLSAEGELLWQACYGGPSEDKLVFIAEGEGGYLAIGHSWTMDRTLSRQHSEGWALGLDASGRVLYEARFGNDKNQQTRYAGWTGDFWAVTGYTQYMAEETEWIVSLQPDGTWSLARGEW